MREPYRIEFVASSSVTVWMPMLDAFKFKPKGRAARLQRWAWKFLQWAKALEQAHEPQVKVTRHLIDADKFMERIFKQRAAMFEMHREPKRLLIGSEDYAELMHSPEVTPHLFSFHADYHIGDGHSRYGRLVGLNVEVIPWMRGMVVMP